MKFRRDLSKLRCAFTVSLCLLACVLNGCYHKPQLPTIPANELLKQTMARYQSLTSFQAESQWTAQSDKATFAEKRTLQLQTPNLFKIVSTHDDTLMQATVSDGYQVTEYSNLPGMEAFVDNPPDSLSKLTTKFTQSALYCGTPLYRFFAGPTGLADLVSSKAGDVAYGGSVTIDGVDCETVNFTSTDFGRVAVAIGKDKLVHRIQYDGVASLAKCTSEEKDILFSAPLDPKTKSFGITETFSKIVTDKPLHDTAYDTRLPEDIPPMQGTMRPGGVQMADAETPPVPIGAMAPDFTIKPLGGGAPVTLSSLRGHVVMLDFWATWCPACRLGLPETQKIADRYRQQGLTVMAIGAEDPDTMTQFINENKYTFSVYRDDTGSAMTAFKIDPIPAIAVIDKQGKLSAFLIGLHAPKEVEAALIKAGLAS